jgi:hypothetical protein
MYPLGPHCNRVGGGLVGDVRIRLLREGGVTTAEMRWKLEIPYPRFGSLAGLAALHSSGGMTVISR